MIDGEKIYLRLIEQSDTEKIVAWRNQLFVRNQFIYREDFTKESHEQWLETMIAVGKAIQFIIHLKANGQAIGSVYLREIDVKNQKAEYGIFIGEEQYLSKGIGTEVAKLMIDYAFGRMQLHKVMLRVLATNKRAIRSYKKAGFVQEGYFKDDVRISGKYEDVVYMGIVSPQNVANEK